MATTGRPFLVMTMRSWVFSAEATSSLRRFFASANDVVVIAMILARVSRTTDARGRWQTNRSRAG